MLRLPTTWTAPFRHPNRLSAKWRYASAPAATLLALGIQYALLPQPNIAPFVFLFSGVALAAWIGGRTPGLLAVAFSALAANYVFLDPHWAWSTSASALAATGMFMVAASIVANLCASFREAAIRAEGTADSLRRGEGELRERERELQLTITRLKETELALRETDRQKDAFIAMLSHELRNPLAPISNSLYILDRAPPKSEQARRAKAVIDRQVGHMTRLVDDLLDVTRVARGKIQLHRERLDLAELLRRTAEDYRPTFAAGGVALDVSLPEEPLCADGDATRLAQAVGNLLNNAAKFTPRGGRATLSLEQTGADMAAITVRDTGAGIAPGTLTELFKPFVQADETLDRSRGGLGLGLVLVKALVELHRGSVTVASKGLGQGAEFVVALPLDEPAPRLTLVAGTQEGAAVVSAARRVLVIEDNVDAAESLKEALELSGHEVELAHTGLEGLGKARERLPDVVLCDIGLPGMSGYDVARAMRSDEALSGVFLVAVTGYTRSEDRQRAAEAGFNKHLAKPFTLEALDEVVGGVTPSPAGAKAPTERLAWATALSMEDPELDGQHRELFRRLEELDEAVRLGHGHEGATRLLGFLVEHLVGHFADEERFMERTAFPDLSGHKREHELFRETLAELQKRRVDPGAVEAVVTAWVRTHVMGADMRLAEHGRERSAQV